MDQLILNNFPQTSVSLGFLYGSKVIKQSKTNNDNALVDIIFAVDNPYLWHKENYVKNKSHYSILRYLPNNLEYITKIQESFGARIYFNPYVNLGDLSIKYGIIKTEHLIQDLLHWDKLYVAGRLHKPVELIINSCDTNNTLKSAIRFNRESALRAALLQLPETFNPQLLYNTIVGLSYHGDIRMLFGEDKNKINNIVEAQSNAFEQMYLPMIKMNSLFKDYVFWNEAKQIYTQDLSSKTNLRNLKLLPKNLRKTVCQLHSNQARSMETDIVLASVSRSINCDKIVAQAASLIVRRSSLAQTFKGIFTAGVLKSFKYSQRKLFKSLKSRLNMT